MEEGGRAEEHHLEGVAADDVAADGEAHRADAHGGDRHIALNPGLYRAGGVELELSALRFELDIAGETVAPEGSYEVINGPGAGEPGGDGARRERAGDHAQRRGRERSGDRARRHPVDGGEPIGGPQPVIGQERALDQRRERGDAEEGGAGEDARGPDERAAPALRRDARRRARGDDPDHRGGGQREPGEPGEEGAPIHMAERRLGGGRRDEGAETTHGEHDAVREGHPVHGEPLCVRL